MDGDQLTGIKVLDFGIWRPAPYATQLLAEMGATVIKVEPPGGDPMRAYPALFETLHRAKDAIELDLKDVAGRAEALNLAGGADVVVEGYRPGVAARLGIGYDDVRAVNPSVVYCSLSGLGQTGPLALAPGHDLNYLAWAGALSPDGRPPAEPAIPVADLAGGMAAALRICAALLGRARTGEGEWIDLAMADVLATWTGEAEPVARDADPTVRGVAGYGTFATRDGRWLSLGIVNEDHFWRPLCDVLGLDAHRNLDVAARAARRDELQAALAAAIAVRDRDDLAAELLAADVPAAPVLDRAGMLALPHFRERGVFR